MPKKQVICITTRTTYPSIRIAAAEVGGYESALSAAISHKQRYRKRYWVLKDADVSTSDQIDSWVEPESRSRQQAVQNVTTGQVYPSMRVAALAIGKSPTAIFASIKRDGYCGGFLWKRIKPELYKLLK